MVCIVQFGEARKQEKAIFQRRLSFFSKQLPKILLGLLFTLLGFCGLHWRTVESQLKNASVSMIIGRGGGDLVRWCVAHHGSIWIFAPKLTNRLYPWFLARENPNNFLNCILIIFLILLLNFCVKNVEFDVWKQEVRFYRSVLRKSLLGAAPLWQWLYNNEDAHFTV